MKKTVDAYEKVTNQIIELLEQGTVPWQKPWVGGNKLQPINLKTKKAYRGINVFLLGIQGFMSPYWLGFNQAKEMGGMVRKGAKASTIVYWKPIVTKNAKDEETVFLKGPFYNHVFNLEQIDGIETPITEKVTESTFTPIENAEAVKLKYITCPTIYHNEQQAYYNPTNDIINMPKKETFKTTEGYYTTLFHEMVHSTGHKSRLNREGVATTTLHSTETYSKEELVAEMGASFLSTYTGIIPKTISNSTAYIQSWLRELKNDRTLIIKAGAMAQKACDYILNVKYA